MVIATGSEIRGSETTNSILNPGAISKDGID
jgi:hypothetical protein